VVEKPLVILSTRDVTGAVARLNSAPTWVGPTTAAAVKADDITATEPIFRRFISCLLDYHGVGEEASEQCRHAVCATTTNCRF
jgi:hypothetical protein